MADNISIEEISVELELTISSTEVSITSQPSTTVEIQESPISLEVLQDIVHEVCIEEPSAVEFEAIEAGIVGPAGPEGPQGPQGPEGPAGSDAVSDTRIAVVANEAIEALRIVRAVNASDVLKGSSVAGFVEARALGITTEAIANGASGTVQFFGVVEDVSFTFAAGTPLFLTTDGQITDDYSSLTVYNTTIGHGLGTGAIFIDLQEPVLL